MVLTSQLNFWAVLRRKDISSMGKTKEDWFNRELPPIATPPPTSHQPTGMVANQQCVLWPPVPGRGISKAQMDSAWLKISQTFPSRLHNLKLQISVGMFASQAVPCLLKDKDHFLVLKTVSKHCFNSNMWCKTWSQGSVLYVAYILGEIRSISRS